MRPPDPGGFGENRQELKPAAVLFDLDGTLIDSEPLWFEAERLLVTEYGYAWGPTQAQHLVGWSLWDSATFLREVVGVDLPEQAIIDRMQAHVVAGVQQTQRWQPGALELLAEVRAAAIPAGLVTMSHRQLADVIIEALPHGSFQIVVTGEQVRRGKPHPDPYLLAAERLGVEAADCVAIEDSVTGATSARAAGCAVLVVPAALPVNSLTGVFFRESLRGMSLAGLGGLLDEHRALLGQSGSAAGSSTGVAATG